MATDAKKGLGAAMVGSVAVTTMGSIGRGEGFPEPSRFIALGFVFIVLSVSGDYAPGLAVPMALLVFLTILFMDGEDALGAIGQATEPDEETKVKPEGKDDAPGDTGGLGSQRKRGRK